MSRGSPFLISMGTTDAFSDWPAISTEHRLRMANAPLVVAKTNFAQDLVIWGIGPQQVDQVAAPHTVFGRSNVLRDVYSPCQTAGRARSQYGLKFVI